MKSLPSNQIRKLHAVSDEVTLIEFISALADDREDEIAKEKQNPSSPYGTGANGWENTTIEAFLDAASAWATASMEAAPWYEKPQNPWKRVADILFAGKVYE
ncbi:MAG: hypothetical protein SFY80_07575 [Verrucomicrobiota bacterium]|nr:hypothetical protein [Verrucomicrobiota bacterium]